MTRLFLVCEAVTQQRLSYIFLFLGRCLAVGHSLLARTYIKELNLIELLLLLLLLVVVVVVVVVVIVVVIVVVVVIVLLLRLHIQQGVYYMGSPA
jgi:hypothetical protein